jgi:hypothetical protein
MTTASHRITIKSKVLAGDEAVGGMLKAGFHSLMAVPCLLSTGAVERLHVENGFLCDTNIRHLSSSLLARGALHEFHPILLYSNSA